MLIRLFLCKIETFHICDLRLINVTPKKAYYLTLVFVKEWQIILERIIVTFFPLGNVQTFEEIHVAVIESAQCILTLFVYIRVYKHCDCILDWIINQVLCVHNWQTYTATLQIHNKTFNKVYLLVTQNCASAIKELSFESYGEVNEDEEDDEEDSSSRQAEETAKKSVSMKGKKAGRKAKWAQPMLDDIVDNIYRFSQA